MELLSRIGAENPQALIFPLTVACKSPLKSRQVTASTILESTRREWPTLVEHAELVSAECVRVAVLWEEQWHGALEEAWRQHYHEKNPEGAVEVLMPLHEKVENPGPQTGQEAAFEHRYGEILRRAFKSLNKYMSTKDTQFLHQAWGLYYRLFAQLNTALGNASSVIKLHDAAPRLVHCQDLEIAVPGTYVYSLILLNSRKRNINTRIHIHTGTKREVRSLELPSSIRPCKSFPRSNVRERSHCTEATA